MGFFSPSEHNGVLFIFSLLLAISMCFESCRAVQELLTELKNNTDLLTLAGTKFTAKYKKKEAFCACTSVCVTPRVKYIKGNTLW